MALTALLLTMAIAKPMSENEEKRWRSRRAGGRKAFIWKGVLVFGGAMFFVFVLMTYARGDSTVFNPWFLLVLLVITLLGGYFFGSIGWDASEMRLANTLKSRGEEQEALSILKALASRRRFAKNRELKAVIEQTEIKLGGNQPTTSGP